VVAAANRTQHMVQIGERRFHTIGAPSRVLVSRFPEKRVDGDYDETSNPITSTLSISDHRDGVGVETIHSATNNSWYSTMSQRHSNHLVLQRQTVDTDENAAIGASDVNWLGELGGEIYAEAGESIYKHDNGTSGWGSSLHTFDGVVTDFITCPLAGTDTFVAAVTDGAVEFSTNGTSWTDETNTTGIKHLAFGFREKLWGISADGATYFANTLAGSGTVSWTQVAKLRLPFGEVTKLLIAPGPNPSDDILYAATQTGLFVYNNVAERWIATDLTLPFHESNGTGSTVFRNAIYVNAGLSVYEYTPGEIGGRVRTMGPDLNDGLPSDNQGVIKSMHGTHQELIVVVDGADTAQTDDESLLMELTDGIHTSMTLNAGLGKPTVLGWNTRGWEVKYEAAVAGQGVANNILVTNAYSSYRLWWATGSTVHYQFLPLGIENPSQVAITRRQASGKWYMPWYDANSINNEKTALMWHIDATCPSTAEKITLKYAINYDDSDSALTSLGVVDRSGDFEFPMPSITNPKGVPFRSIRAVLEAERGPNIFSTPDVKKIALVYKPGLDTMWGWNVTLDLSRGAEGYTPKQQRDYLFGSARSALANDRELYPFTMKDDNDGTNVYWVFIANAEAQETAGYSDDAIWSVTLAEARPSIYE
jgi:hypothetical protein